MSRMNGKKTHTHTHDNLYNMEEILFMPTRLHYIREDERRTVVWMKIEMSSGGAHHRRPPDLPMRTMRTTKYASVASPGPERILSIDQKIRVVFVNLYWKRQHDIRWGIVCKEFSPSSGICWRFDPSFYRSRRL